MLAISEFIFMRIETKAQNKNRLNCLIFSQTFVFLVESKI